MPRRAAAFPALIVLSILLSSCSTRNSPVVPTPVATGNRLETTVMEPPATITSSPTGTATSAPTITITPTSVPATATAVPPTPTTVPPTASPRPSLPAATNTAIPTSLPVASKTKRVFLGYYVPYDPSSWLSLETEADNLDYVVAQWTTVDACGNIGSTDDRTLISFARAHGIKVLPSLFTSSQWLNHIVLTEEEVTARAVQNLVSYVIEEGYAGLDVDLEDVTPADRRAYTAFIARLSAALHQKGKLLTVAVPAKTSDTTTGWGGAFEYAALAPYIDLAMIMTYAYTIADSPPGSTAPYDWVDRVIGFTVSQIPPEKVLLGLAFWAYDWNVTTDASARAWLYPQAAAIAQRYGATITSDPASRSATFTYTAGANDPPVNVGGAPAFKHDISVRSQPSCPLPSPTGPPKPEVTPKPTPIPPPVQQHVVWLEDAASTAQRLGLADKYGTVGVGAWRLGQEDPAVWPLLARWRKGQ